MIYGINFNRTPIPPGVKRKFAERVKVSDKRGDYARLVGVGQSTQERDAMLVQANNGHRRLHVEERKTPAGIWYGIYVY